ncbi:hypothetical protein K7432_013522 [Basidiobolus ranarum]|uniref:Uncharacterized protein n=1 Tax=Basidiobolus ranarum TaxID=34480 RepID=A0ABR2WJ88_9FUNG
MTLNTYKLLFSLIYASCQIINLFYQEGWVVDTRIILYVSSVIWFIGSLVRLSVGEITTWYDLVYHSMKLVAFSGYGFEQLKWGQILLKLFNHPIYKFSIYWGIFTIVSNAIVIVLLIVRSVYPYYDYGGYIVKIYSFYIPVLFIGQSFFFLFYGIQFYRGIKVFCLSERTTASFKKLASLNFLAGVGFTVQAAALIVQGTSLPATVAGDMLMFTLAIVSGIICFSPAFALLSIRGTDEHATYAAILNHTWDPSQSNLNASKLRTDSTSNEEEIKLQRSPSRQPLRNEANYRSKANSSSLTLANSNALDFSENECAPSGPINHFESTHRVDFTPLNPPPRPHMRRDHPNEPLQNGSRRLLSDEEDNPAEMVIEIHLMQDPSFTTDWNAPFEHSSDGTFIDEKM